MAKPIISFISLLLSLGFGFFYVIPAYNLNAERRGNIESLSKILSTSGEIKTLIGKTKENLKSIDPTVLARFKVFLPERIDTIRLANNIQYIGIKNRIILSGIKVTPGTATVTPKDGVTASALGGAAQGLVNIISLGAQIDKAQGGNLTTSASEVNDSTGKKYATTRVSFTFTSTFEAFQLLLADLEKSLGLINVTSLSFASSNQVDSKKVMTSSAPMYQYVMEIETYSLQ